MRFHVKNQRKTWLAAALVGALGWTLMSAGSAGATTPQPNPVSDHLGNNHDNPPTAPTTPDFTTWTFTQAQLAAKAPAPRPEDVSSPEAIVKALHDSVSGPQGKWDSARFRSLLLPNALLTNVGPNADGQQAISNVSVADFMKEVQQVHDEGGWFENVDTIINVTTVNKNGGAIASVDYHGTASTTPGGPVVEQGENIETLLWDGARWWVLAASF